MRSVIFLARAAMLLAAAALAASVALAQTRSDSAREKRWADQIVPNLVVGDAVYLQAADGTRFLALYTAAQAARAAVLLTHGPGLHPDHGITGELRALLPDRGYTTLSLQMPVLAADDEDSADYAKLFPEAALRIAAGMRFLEDKGARRIAVVSHAMGSAMAYSYLRRNRDAPVFAWVALSFYGVFKDMAGAPFPLFDIYGSSDYRGIRGPAADRKRILDALPGSRQLAVPEGGRFLAGGEKTVLKEVPEFIDSAARLGSVR